MLVFVMFPFFVNKDIDIVLRYFILFRNCHVINLEIRFIKFDANDGKVCYPQEQPKLDILWRINKSRENERIF